MAIDSPLGVEILLLLLCYQTLVTGCVFLVCVCLFHVFFQIIPTMMH